MAGRPASQKRFLLLQEMKGNPGLAARDSSTRHSSSNLPSVFCPPPARLPAPDDSTRSVNTAGLAELGRDVLLASLPAAMDTVCTAKRRPAAALFQQLEGSSAVEQRISIHSSASRLLGYLGDGPSEDGPSASRGMSTTRLSADSLLQKTAARDASKSGSSTPADGMTPR